MKLRFWLLLFLTFLLSACPTNLNDFPTQAGPGIEASSETVETGDPVQITLSVGLFGGGEEYIFDKQILGACFKTLSFKTLGGSCTEGKVPLPESLEILDRASFEKDFGKVVLKPNQHIELTHTFSFTATEPGTVQVVAFLGYLDEQGQVVYGGMNQSKSVSFE